MAANSTKVQSSIVLKVKTGTNAKGENILKNIRYSKVKVTASDEDVLAVGTVIGTLLAYPIQQIVREDQNVIING
jgi:hypothetical protein